MSQTTRAGPAWSSSVTFYLATVGASVGLGSIWRFPYLAGSSGGSAFIVVFVGACLLIATPLLAAEFLIGRRAARSPVEAAGVLATQSGLSSRWAIIGILGTAAGFAIISYYAVIAGWTIAYAWKFATGSMSGLSREGVQSSWRLFLQNPLEIGFWHLIFISIITFVSARGVSRGIELANRVRAPVLLALMLLLVVYALLKGDVTRGLTFAFAPNFSAITPQVILAAIGQAFYATGVGMAMMIAYGAYLRRGTSLISSSLIISGAILLVSLLATLIVFPLVFLYDLDPKEGADLVFIVLATVFAEIPGGRLFGTTFFVLLIFAALTPSLAGIEPVVAWLQQKKDYSRSKAVYVTAFCVWLCGVASVLSFNRWSSWHPFGWIPGFETRTFFGSVDYIASNWMLPVGALITSLLVGWAASPAIVNDELSESRPFVRTLCIWLLRFVCPVAIAAVIAANLVS